MLYQENKCVSPLSDSCMRWEERSERESCRGGIWSCWWFTTWAVKETGQHQHVCHDRMASTKSHPAVRRAGGRWEEEYDEEEDFREWSAIEKSATSHRWELAQIKITHPCLVRLHLLTQMWTQSGKKHLVGCFVRVLYLWLCDHEIVRWFTN